MALICGTSLALIESVGATLLTAEHFPESGWPMGLVTAAIGKAIVTHVLFWGLALPIVAILGWVVARRRFAGSPDAWLAVAFLLLAGLIVVPTNLAIIYYNTPFFITLSWIAIVALAAVAFVVLRSGKNGTPSVGLRRSLNFLALIALVVMLITGITFARSPIFHPAAYRVDASSVAKADSRSKRPNVLWIIMDTVRADHLSCYGYAKVTTPFLERFAENAMVFDRAMSSGIWTVPSHASMFTGRPIRGHGMDLDHLWLDRDHRTVAELLRESGYTTAALSNNPWVSPYANLTQGFDQVVNLHYLPKLTRVSLEYLLEQRGVTPMAPWFDNDYGAAITNWMLSDWLDEQTRYDEPFMLYVNYMDAHLPYRVPAEYRRMFMNDAQVARSYELRWSAYGHITQVMSERFNVEGPQFMDPGDIEIMQRQYDAAIRYLDDRVGELVGMFERRGLLDNTLVIIASDHGEYLNTHGMWGHRYLAYDDVSRVALLVRPPGGSAGERVAAAVSLADLFPTILRTTLGDDAVEGIGDDMASAAAVSRDLLSPDRDAERMAVVEYSGPTPTKMAHGKSVGIKTGGHRDHPQIAAVSDRFKFIISKDKTRELYDVVADPREMNNLVESKPDVGDEFAAFIDTWLERTPRYTPNDAEAGDAVSELIDSLNDLGYAGGGVDDEP